MNGYQNFIPNQTKPIFDKLAYPRAGTGGEIRCVIQFGGKVRPNWKLIFSSLRLAPPYLTTVSRAPNATRPTGQSIIINIPGGWRALIDDSQLVPGDVTRGAAVAFLSTTRLFYARIITFKRRLDRKG